jgi:hypothetical protein
MLIILAVPLNNPPNRQPINHSLPLKTSMPLALKDLITLPINSLLKDSLPPILIMELVLKRML